MSVRANFNLQDAAIEAMQVKNAVTITEGVGVKYTATDGEVDLCAAGDKVDGVALETKLGDGTAKAQVAFCVGKAKIPVKIVGTVAAGDYLEAGTSGFVTRVLGGGTTVRYIAGTATQQGVTGDMIGMYGGKFAAGSA